MKVDKTVLIPSLLLVYLVVMALLGYSGFAAGKTSATEYFGTIAVSLLAIVLLYFCSGYRDRLRRKRLEEEKNYQKQKNKHNG